MALALSLPRISPYTASARGIQQRIVSLPVPKAYAKTSSKMRDPRDGSRELNDDRSDCYLTDTLSTRTAKDTVPSLISPTSDLTVKTPSSPKLTSERAVSVF